MENDEILLDMEHAVSVFRKQGKQAEMMKDRARR